MKIRDWIASANQTMLTGARSGHVARIVGVFNIGNSLRLAWVHQPLWLVFFTAASGIYCMWVSTLIRRDITVSIPLPHDSVIKEVRLRKLRELAETDPNKVM